MRIQSRYWSLIRLSLGCLLALFVDSRLAAGNVLDDVKQAVTSIAGGSRGSSGGGLVPQGPGRPTTTVSGKDLVETLIAAGKGAEQANEHLKKLWESIDMTDFCKHNDCRTPEAARASYRRQTNLVEKRRMERAASLTDALNSLNGERMASAEALWLAGESGGAAWCDSRDSIVGCASRLQSQVTRLTGLRLLSYQPPVRQSPDVPPVTAPLIHPLDPLVERARSLAAQARTSAISQLVQETIVQQDGVVGGIKRRLACGSVVRDSERTYKQSLTQLRDAAAAEDAYGIQVASDDLRAVHTLAELLSPVCSPDARELAAEIGRARDKNTNASATVNTFIQKACTEDLANHSAEIQAACKRGSTSTDMAYALHVASTARKPQ